MKVIVWPLLWITGWLMMVQGVSADTTSPASDSALYTRRCGSCHFAYPPGLLPARSWAKLLANLPNHFGANAALPQEDTGAITAYVTARAAERSSSILSGKILQSLRGGEAPERIVDLPHIRHEHEEIPRRLIAENPQVKSLSNCASCHPRAQEGSFRESEVDIPGHGRWQD
jgi:hypothetical protein